MKTESDAFKGLYDIVARLRAPDGCPWDREQTPSTLRGDLIEETYECVEAIDEQKPEHIKEELGDIFLLATMISYMHEQEGLFSVSEVLETISKKLVRRHPHVFGDAKVNGSGEVLQNWAKIKVEQEGRAPKDSALDDVSKALPPLDRAYKLQKKAAKLGFDWDTPAGILAKIQEELVEVQDEFGVERIDCPALEAELGDVLFTVINLCRFLKVEPSVALQRANIKFTHRFKYIEKKMKETAQEMKKENSAVMETFWQEAKGDESGQETR
ncbi:MAG: nucleoside triphosphate pyrophosphohydrolase [Treponema sp.]|jgi:tetrapyrrole methylase family protein/MazG family protein|nr:nucleoside triphosphate pyrophosphohydrolase [Treponema sp.]